MKAPAPTDADMKKLTPSKEIEDMKKKIEEGASALRCLDYLCQAGKKPLPDGDVCKKKYKSVDPCEEANKKREKMDADTKSLAEAQTKSDTTKNILEAYRSTDANLQGIVASLEEEIKNLEEDLKSAPKESPIIDKAKGKGDMTQREIEENWMSFSFDSKTASKIKESDSKTYKGTASFSAGGLFWSVGGGASYSRSEQDFHQEMSMADVSVSAKLLRVAINRNWFRPSIFRISNSLQMVSYN